MLYHISDNPDLKELVPRIPHYDEIENQEDIITPRVCFSTTINGCLHAKGISADTEYTSYISKYKVSNLSDIIFNDMLTEVKKNFLKTIDDYDAENLQYYVKNGRLKYQYFYVYCPDEFVECRPSDVFDVKFTNEVWVEKPVKVCKVGVVYVLSRALISDSVKCKIKNGKTIKVDHYRYNYLTLPPNFTSSIEYYKRAIEKQDN